MKEVIIIVIIIGFANCGILNSSKKPIGNYSWEGIYGVGAEITLNKDYSFKFEWWQGLINGETKGKWSKRGDIVYLTSDFQPEQKRVPEIIKLTKSENKNFEVFVKDGEYPLMYSICVLKKDTNELYGTDADTMGMCNIPWIEEGRSIDITFLGYEKAQISLDNLTTNRYEVRMVEKEREFYYFFTNESWIFDGKRLIVTDSIDKRWNFKYLEKK